MNMSVSASLPPGVKPPQVGILGQVDDGVEIDIDIEIGGKGDKISSIDDILKLSESMNERAIFCLSSLGLSDQCVQLEEVNNDAEKRMRITIAKPDTDGKQEGGRFTISTGQYVGDTVPYIKVQCEVVSKEKKPYPLVNYSASETQFVSFPYDEMDEHFGGFLKKLRPLMDDWAGLRDK